MASTSSSTDKSSDLPDDFVPVEQSLSQLSNQEFWKIYHYDARARAAWKMVRTLAREMIDEQQKLKTKELRELSPMLLTALDVLRARACACLAAIRDGVESNLEAKHTPEERKGAWTTELMWATNLFNKIQGFALVRNHVARFASTEAPLFFQAAVNYAEVQKHFFKSYNTRAYMGLASMPSDLRTRVGYMVDVWTIIKYWADNHSKLLPEKERVAVDGLNFADRVLNLLDNEIEALKSSY